MIRRLLAAFALATFLASSGAIVDAKPRKPQSQSEKVQRAEHYIKRSAAVRRAFMRQTGYPTGRPGYVIDHIIPLACGGPDAVSNLQWQSIADARAKDRWERRGC